MYSNFQRLLSWNCFLAQVPDHQSRGQSASNSAFCTKWWQPRVMTMMAPFCNEAIHYPLVTNSRANWPNSKSPWFEHAKSSNSSGHSFATCQRIPEPIMVGPATHVVVPQRCVTLRGAVRISTGGTEEPKGVAVRHPYMSNMQGEKLLLGVNQDEPVIRKSSN